MDSEEILHAQICMFLRFLYLICIQSLYLVRIVRIGREGAEVLVEEFAMILRQTMLLIGGA